MGSGRRALSRTEITRRRYDRIAPFYDLMESPIENLRFGSWRERLMYRITGKRILEVGVGTGKNVVYYPPNVKITAIDLSPNMIARARKRIEALRLDVDLRQMDVQQLDFPDQTFDTVFATFVFCSVPDPVLGLRELHRVCTREGHMLLLEHMRPGNSLFGIFFDLLNPLVFRATGANINRRTIDNLNSAGWRIETLTNVASDVVRWIEARP